MPTVIVPSNHNRQIIDITDLISGQLSKGNGIATAFICHTTAAVTTADLDPGTDEDFLDFLRLITPEVNWRHPHNPAHAPDHLLASMIGSSVSVPFENSKLLLGSWQRIILVELNGPRDRLLEVRCSQTV